MIRLPSPAVDKSTYVIIINFKDTDGTALAPDTMSWTLHDRKGNVINSRSAVSVSSPTAAQAIVLSGDDLANSVNDTILRYLTASGTFTSSTYGSSLPWVEVFEFSIEPSIIV